MREPASSEAIASRSTFRSGWLWLLVILLALGAAAVFALPSAVRYGLEQWFYAHGASAVSIGELHANPVSGDIHVRDLVVDTRDGELLRADDLRLGFLWKGLWHHSLSFDTVTLRGAKMRVDVPITAAVQRRDPRDWPVRIRSLQLSDVELLWPIGGHNVPWRIHAGTLEPVSSRPQDQTRVKLDGDLAGAPLRLRGNLTLSASAPEADGELEIDSLDLSALASATPALSQLQGLADVRLHLRLLRDVEGHVRLTDEGTIRMHDLGAASDQMSLKSAQALWAGKGQVQLTGAGSEFHQQGEWKLDQVQLAMPSGSYRTESLDWHGQMKGTVYSTRAPTVSADGKLEAQNISTRNDRMALELDARRAQWQGVLSEGVLDVPGGVTAQGQLVLDDLHVSRVRQQTTTLFDATQVSLRALDMKGTYRVTADALELLQYQLHEPSTDRGPLARGEWARFENVALIDRQHFKASRLLLNDVHLAIEKDPDGQWHGIGIGGSGSNRTLSSAAATLWRIDRIAIQNGNNTIHYEDRSVEPAFARTIHLSEFSIADLDSGEPLRPSPIGLQGTMSDGSQIVAVGKLRPFAQHLNLALKTKFFRVPLAPLNAYSKSHLGVEFKTGQMDVESNLHVIDGKLRSENELLARNLKLSTAGEPSRVLQDRLRLPITVALALLRDADGVTRVELPLRGDLEAQNFDRGDTFDRALGSALHDAALASVRNILQPFGLAEGAADMNTDSVRLEPLRFRAGSAALNPVSTTYLRRLAALMQQHPEVRLQICPVTTSRDHDAGKALATLWRDRSNAIEAELSETHGISEKRMHSCTRNTSTDRGYPRAELRLQ